MYGAQQMVMSSGLLNLALVGHFALRHVYMSQFGGPHTDRVVLVTKLSPSDP